MGNVVSTQPLTASEAAMAEMYRKQKARKTIVRWACFIAAIGLIIWGASPWYSIKLNGVESIKGTLFILDKTVRPKHGEIAYFHPPSNLYPAEMDFGKYIAGSPGDVVTIEDRKFFINGHYIGYAYEHTTGGKPLEMSAPGVIPEGYYFMWGEHEQSYDSRYADIGWIPESSIIGRLHRIF